VGQDLDVDIDPVDARVAHLDVSAVAHEQDAIQLDRRAGSPPGDRPGSGRPGNPVLLSTDDDSDSEPSDWARTDSTKTAR